MKTKIFLSMLVIIVAVSLVVGGTMAWFTDTAEAAGQTFTTGTVDISLGGDIPINQLGMAPGDIVTTNLFTIENTGSLGMLMRMYIVPTYNTPGLASKLWVKITMTDTDWVITNESKYDSVRIDGYIPLSYLFNHYIDNVYAAFHVSTQLGGLQPGATMNYKIEVKLDENAGNAYQNTGFVGKIVVNGTQFKNQTEDNVQW